MKHLFLIPVFFVFALNTVLSQPLNDNCSGALVLPPLLDYCSTPGDFTNEGATPSDFDTPECWDTIDNDVWYKFTALKNAVNIIVFGKGAFGTLQNPMIALYKDSECSGDLELLKCNYDQYSSNIVELNKYDLVQGEKYLIRIDGQNGATGNFKFCMKSYNPIPEPGQDCSSATILKDTTPFVVNYLSGPGDDPYETSNTCIFDEKNSTWFKWKAKNDGNLTFTISPLHNTDDIDIALFELPGGLDDCENKTVLRCDATYSGNNSSCGSDTGLDMESTDLEEDYNCDAGEDGFVKFLDMQKGKSYALVVNNWSATRFGFSIKFGGTGTFDNTVSTEEYFDEEINKEIYIPNIFTPNNDGNNDYFTVFNKSNALKIEKMMIFDRTGKLIFQKSDFPLNMQYMGWDGTMDGQLVNNGVYVYIIKVKFEDGEYKQYAGDVTILR